MRLWKIGLVLAILIGAGLYFGLLGDFNFGKEKASITPRMVNHPNLGTVLQGGSVQGWMDGKYASGWSFAAAGTFELSVGKNHTFEVKIFTSDGTLFWSAKNSFYVPEYTAGEDYDLSVDWNTKVMSVVKSAGG